MPYAPGNNPGQYTHSELLPFDQDAVRSIRMRVVVPGKKPQARAAHDEEIQFQFPPKISSDSKKAKWDAHDFKGYEPMYLFMGAEARAISLKMDYVVYGEKWTIHTIKKNVRNIKAIGYAGTFTGASQAGSSLTRAPYVRLTVYDIIEKLEGEEVDNAGAEESMWIMDDLSIKYSDEHVSEYSIGNRNKNERTKIDGEASRVSTWPLHTEITMNLKMVTLAAMLHWAELKLTQKDVKAIKAEKGRVFPLRAVKKWY